MSKKSIITRHNKIKNYVKKYESQRKDILKNIKTNKNNIKIVFDNYIKLQKFNRNSCKVRLTPICLLTGRTKGFCFYNKYPICRMKLRELARNGLLPGVIKSSI